MDRLCAFATVVALFFSLFDFYHYTGRGPYFRSVCPQLSQLPPSESDRLVRLCNGFGNSAWHGVFGWLGVLFALGAAIVLVVGRWTPLWRRGFAIIRLVAVGLDLTALVLVAAAGFIVPDGRYGRLRVPADSGQFAVGHGLSYWVVLGALLIGCVSAVVAAARGGVPPERGRAIDPEGW